jgi:hypothetical protein
VHVSVLFCAESVCCCCVCAESAFGSTGVDSTKTEILHRECHRLSATGDYPADCAYRSYDPRTNRDYAGRARNRTLAVSSK